ncbi:acetate--CoA ligase family protein [Georgenia yuyongxinii]|uniref:Acetate--CoA ligase family protein n=1 Tax=Georgenia yuyongxinii TaxID=2589797 RepID=A0A552WXH1_9MICO|nr:acetate--CoA ligase family protein [Georgenia yuyongxinii]TRW47477.1 acetate--CoA ligase family protein [Georgenia yuyongxinii]
MTSTPTAPRLAAATLEPLFAPSGVMVVGASATPGKLGAVMAESLRGHDAPLYLVNNRAAGMHATIGDALAAAGGEVDLAVMCIPAPATAQALRECAAGGVRAALVCAGGFGEAGPAGEAHERAIVQAVRETGIRLLGPNTSGFFVPGRGLRASFVPGVAAVRPGPVAVVAASGGVNHALAFRLQRAGVGVSLAVGLGASLDVGAEDVLEHLVGDDGTRVVALHLETVKDGPALLRAVERLAAIKPVVALVVGRSDVSEFAASHTGALATSWRTTRALLRQAGAVLVDDEEALVDAVTALAGRRLAPSSAPGVALITAQAGPGLLVADALQSAGVDLPRLSLQTQAAVAEHLPPITFQANPVDTGRPGAGFDRVVAAVAADPAVDALAVYGLTEPVVDLPAAVARSGAADVVPVLVGVDGPQGDLDQARESAAALGLPLLAGPTALARGLVALVEDARAQYARSVEPAPAVEPAHLTGPWDEIRAKELLDQLGVRTPPRRRCTNRSQAHEALGTLGGPVAVKLVDAAVLHKTELGGVHLNIRTTAEMDHALDALEAVGARELLVESMAATGVDLIVGARRDHVFGPVVLLGLGGTAAEVMADVAIRSAPLSEQAAADMLDDLQGRALLLGHRSGPVVDRTELARVLTALGGVLRATPAIDEVEVNPLRLTASGLLALDAVVIPSQAAHAGDHGSL